MNAELKKAFENLDETRKKLDQYNIDYWRPVLAEKLGLPESKITEKFVRDYLDMRLGR